MSHKIKWSNLSIAPPSRMLSIAMNTQHGADGDIGLRKILQYQAFIDFQMGSDYEKNANTIFTLIT